MAEERAKWIAVGALGNSTELPFQADGITLAQALAKARGLSDFAADPAGTFIFRFEPASVVRRLSPGSKLLGTPLVPVVYRIDIPDGGPEVDMPPPVARGTVMCGSRMPSLETSGRAAEPPVPYGAAERMPATISSTMAGPPRVARLMRSIAGQRSVSIAISCWPRARSASRAGAPSSLRSTGERVPW